MVCEEELYYQHLQSVDVHFLFLLHLSYVDLPKNEVNLFLDLHT
jgi:hypothetical protein